MYSKDNKVLVSVLMCVYNEETQFLRDAIESILNQTYAGFEFLIISDNPQNDRVNNIIREYQDNDNRITFKINEQNIGLTCSLNIGLRQCKGKYVVRMDADDVSLPNRIADQVAYMETHPEITASGGNAIRIDENNNIIENIIVQSEPHIIKRELLFTCPVIHPATIIRRVWNDKSIEYDETFRYAQDYALWVSVFKNGGIVSNIDKFLIKYRCSKKQIHSAHGDEQRECAIRISHNALSMFNINIPEDNISLWDRLRQPEQINKDEYNIFSGFIISFFENNQHIGKVDLSIICQMLISNYLQRTKMSMIQYVKAVVLLSSRTKTFSLRRLISAVHVSINRTYKS